MTEGRMIEGKRTIDCDITTLDWLGKRIAETKFCKQECPVPQDKRSWGCGCRPLSYMKECPMLNRYNKRIEK